MLTDVTDNELKSVSYQDEMLQRLRRSKYYITENVKKDG